MEDDEGDTLMSVEEPIFGERVAKDEDRAAVLQDDTDNRRSFCSLEEEHDKLKSGSQDNMKSASCVETAPITSERVIEKNNGTLASDSDAPESPKKVNGEVELSKCDRAEHSSDIDFSVDNALDKDSRSAEDEDDDTDSESENLVNRQKRKHGVIPLSEEVSDAAKDDGQNSESIIEYKGFKKRILAQTSVTANNVSESGDKPLHSTKSVFKCKKSPLGEVVSEPQHVLLPHQTLPDGTQSSAQLKEYAQYLGLQPTVKFKCYKCGESGFPSMLKLQEHQNTCLKNCNKMQTVPKPISTPPASEPTPSTNFKITRKVYLCSACGTYYENWNLFLHMREVHKRHICLFCLGMFSQVDKLATHLSGKHGVVEAHYASSEQFISDFKGGSCFLMCCTCERIFSERENFFDHSCSEGLVINTDKACSLCGLRGAHFPTCRRAFTDSSSPPPPRPPSSSSSVSATMESPPESTQNSQLSIQEHSLSVTKYLVPVGKVPGKQISQKPVMVDNTGDSQEKSRDLSDIDDDYDISNAASFCHVNIHEPLEKQKPLAVSKAKTCKGKSQDVDNKVTAELKPTGSSSDTNINENCAETNDNNRDEDGQDNGTVANSTNAVVREKEIQENQEYVDDQSGKIVVEFDGNMRKGELESDSSYQVSMTDLQSSQDHKLQSPVMEELESNTENDTETRLQEETSLIPLLQKETIAKSSPKSDVSPETSPQTETKVASVTPSVTEVDSESESSESGNDTDDSSTSSEASSEETDHEDTKNKEKINESDVDNADSDKLSLVVDENKSEEEEKMEVEEEKTDDGEKYNIEDKMSGAEDTRHDEPKSDTEMVQNTVEDTQEYTVLEDEKVDDHAESIQLAGDDVPLLELTLEEHLDSMNIQTLLKESVKVSCLNCVYCNHAKKIAVNGKQLALHLLAEHRFAPVVCSDSGELTEVDGFVEKLKTSLSELQHMFFNTDSYDNMDQTCMHPYDRTYECFHCHVLTTLHKELYVHNRKMHQKTILLCIMCKSNFYSYSELLCHLCPGIYVPESNINFRCCLCTVDGLPSAFRLMVHLRKRHHACDVCLETTGDQQKLSNHVWKHKLHHLCYRCGIAYRNKPDITKHLFWKHGTESVLCKKCLQKKWPHVYHFCIPPNAFVCEECNSSFSRAVALKVHKRLHAGDLPYPCTECEEHFISRKLLAKHQEKHREPSAPKDTVETRLQENGPIREIESQENKIKIKGESLLSADMLVHEDAITSGNSVQEDESQVCDTMTAPVSKGDLTDAAVEAPHTENLGEALRYEDKDVGEKKSKVVDVYDLPPLNLSSESDDSDDDDDETKQKQLNVKADKPVSCMESVAVNETANLKEGERISEALSQADEEVQQSFEVVDGIWDNFKTYKANLERRESQHTEIGERLTQKTESELQIQINERQIAELISVIYMDHDYCGPFAGTSQSVDIEEQSKDVLVSEVKADEHVILSQEDAEKTEPKDKSEEEMKACDADHNYCYTNASRGVENGREEGAVAQPVSAVTSLSKKKQKSPKKKQKHSASSSSSDSSSNSDSSTCSCGTNCSCSSSSSSTSGTSSSQSSDSESSSSEGRRRQTARRERRRERAKRRKVEETEDATPKAGDTEAATNGPPEQNDVPPLATSVEPEDIDLPVRESDLDTDETETDEDFYDKYPQKQANKLLAEKRNQLLLLAAVAPVNNGTMSQSGQSPPPSSIEEPIPKKKVKTKKHKKLHQHNSSENKVESKLKLNIPTDYYSTHTPIFSKATMPATSVSSSMNSTTLATPARSTQSPFVVSHLEPSAPTTPYHSTGSGSETDSKRLSKRKRVPKRFYGDSSDDEPDQPPAKWRKVNPVPVVQPTPGCSNSVSLPEPFQVPAVNEEKSEEEAAEDSDSDREDTKKSSSDSSNSESDVEKEQGDDDDDDDLSDADSEAETSSAAQTHVASAERKNDAVQQKNENLYCYCQCPYDEVSEMIACDGKDCTIEWFHFECVGIMVPPKGKWFCPDCRKRAAARSEYLLHV